MTATSVLRWTGLLVAVTGLGLTAAARAGERALRITDAGVAKGQRVTLSVEMDAQGDENGVAASFSFDTKVLTFVSLQAGRAAKGATCLVNTKQLDEGVVAVAMILSPGKAYEAGTREVFQLTLQAAADAPPGPTPITFCDKPVRRELVTVKAAVVKATWSPGTLTIKE